jgi:nucleotide-binding universal stress UspA family protein
MTDAAVDMGTRRRIVVGVAIADGDLLVAGTERGRSVQRLVHGSVSGYCCQHAQCPVVVVPAADGAGRDASRRPARRQS